MRRLGTFVVRRRRAVITAWIIVLLAAGAIGSSAFTALSSGFGSGASTESGRVAERLDELAETGGEIAVVIDDIDLDDTTAAAEVGSALQDIAAIPGVLAVVDPWSTDADALRATDGRAALAVVTIEGGLTEDAELELAHRIGERRSRHQCTRGARRRQRPRRRAVRQRRRTRPPPR